MPGVIAGVYLELPLGGHLSVQPELVDPQKARERLPGPGPTAFLTERFDYVEVPILVCVRPPVTGVACTARPDRTATDVSVVLGLGFSTGRAAIEGRMTSAFGTRFLPRTGGAATPS